MNPGYTGVVVPDRDPQAARLRRVQAEGVRAGGVEVGVGEEFGGQEFGRRGEVGEVVGGRGRFGGSRGRCVVRVDRAGAQ